jgi:phosphoglycerol transferase
LSAARGFRRREAVTAVVVALTASCGVWYLLPNFAPSMVDSPELRGLTLQPSTYRVLAVVGIVATLVWAFDARRAAQVFLFMLMPVMVLSSNWQVTSEVRKRQVADSYDEAGYFAKRFLGPAVSRLAVVAPNPSALLRSLFHIDNASTKTVQLDAGSLINDATLPNGVSWLLLIGDYDLPRGGESCQSLGKYKLISVGNDYQVDLKQALWPGVLTGTRGLSSPEAWGTWSTGREVQFEFACNLPSHFRLSLDARAFGPNSGDKFRVAIGREEYSFRLGEMSQTLSFDFKDAGNERIVKIFVPHPTVPRSTGLNDDLREIGIGLSQLRITRLNSEHFD